MSIVEKRGNIFATECGVVAVTVNCVGDMGAGIALEAKYRHPELAAAYAGVCERGELAPGKLLLWEHSTPRILCFPTKVHWRHPSKMSYVTDGLAKLAATYRQKGIGSIALPHLGASKGGLDWNAVRPQVDRHLGHLEDLLVEVWEYTPDADDELFISLQTSLAHLDRGRVAQAVGITPNAAGILLERLVGSGPRNMAVLHRARGFGKKSLEATYAYAMRAQRGESDPVQLDLLIT